MQYTLSYSDRSILVNLFGAELVSLKKGDTEYLYQKAEGFWQRQSPILFPIVGGLKDGKYIHDDREFSLLQHGFARDMEWEKGESTENTLTFRLISTLTTLTKYPFNFEILLSYILTDTGLRVEYIVKNTGSDRMYFSLGAHPAFALDDSMHEYSLIFDRDDHLSVDRLEGGLITYMEELDLEKNKLFLSEDIFETDAIILRNLISQKIILMKKDEKILTMNRGNFPDFGIWKQPSAPFLCLEPWSGYADLTDASGIFSEKSGIVVLEQREEKKFWWSVEI